MYRKPPAPYAPSESKAKVLVLTFSGNAKNFQSLFNCFTPHCQIRSKLLFY